MRTPYWRGVFLAVTTQFRPGCHRAALGGAHRIGRQRPGRGWLVWRDQTFKPAEKRALVAEAVKLPPGAFRSSAAWPRWTPPASACTIVKTWRQRFRGDAGHGV